MVLKTGENRRSFMGKSLTGLAAVMAGSAVTSVANGSSAQVAAGTAGERLAYDPWSRLRAVSSRARQLWTVVYVDPEHLQGNLERDIEATFNGGADAAVLELGKDPATLERAVAHARRKYPTAKIGVNYLGGEGDEYGYKTSFRLASAYDLDIVWTDFCGVDLIRELPEISLHEIEAARAPNAFYCSGIHMKYGTLLNPDKPIEQSALQAMGWVDGIVITGPKTGVPTDPDRARRVRSVVGSYPMGAASGVSEESYPAIRDYVDYCLVNTSISDPDHRLIEEKVRRLRRLMD
jgi:hypothetical protein